MIEKIKKTFRKQFLKLSNEILEELSNDLEVNKYLSKGRVISEGFTKLNHKAGNILVDACNKNKVNIFQITGLKSKDKNIELAYSNIMTNCLDEYFEVINEYFSKANDLMNRQFGSQ